MRTVKAGFLSKKCDFDVFVKFGLKRTAENGISDARGESRCGSDAQNGLVGILYKIRGACVNPYVT